jgi:uncharacterized protein YpbB
MGVDVKFMFRGIKNVITSVKNQYNPYGFLPARCDMECQVVMDAVVTEVAHGSHYDGVTMSCSSADLYRLSEDLDRMGYISVAHSKLIAEKKKADSLRESIKNFCGDGK